MNQTTAAPEEKSSKLDAIVRKMVCGSIFLELLETKQNIKLNKEGKRRFFIGLICEIQTTSDGKADTAEPVDPFVLGYLLSMHLKSQTGTDIADPDEKKIRQLWKKYHLTIPGLRPFFISPIDGLEFSYTGIYNTLINKLKAEREADETSVADTALYEAEAQAERFARSFFQTKESQAKIDGIYLEHNPLEEYMQQAEAACSGTTPEQPKDDDSSALWCSDKKKEQYYRYRWGSICIKAFPSDEMMQKTCKLFFESLLTEIHDLDENAENYKNQQKGSAKKLRWLTFGIFVVNAANVAVVGFSELFGWKIASIVLTLIITLLTGLKALEEKKVSDVAARETWLRHSLNRSRLVLETEMFFAGKNDYHAVWGNKADKIQECIILFMNRINAWRSEDYKNFFINMNCINYDVTDEKVEQLDDETEEQAPEEDISRDEQEEASGDDGNAEQQAPTAEDETPK